MVDFVDIYAITYMRRCQAELEQVRLAKRAVKSKDKRPKKKVKSETTPFIPGEIIDLTL